MDIAYLTPTDWEEFNKRFPDAKAFLVRKSLEHEKVYIQHELEQNYLRPERRRWLTERLAQLTQFDN